MRILISGSAGQLGQELVQLLSHEQLAPFDHDQLDISDPESVNKACRDARPDWIVNCAAYNDVDGAETHSELAMAVNGKGPGYLARAAEQIGARMIHISTDYVFDGRKGEPYSEDDHPNPLSAYGRSKYEGERRVMDSGASASVFRTAWLYGRHGSNFVNSILALVAKGRPLRVVSDQLGSPTSTADLAGAIAEFIHRPHDGLYHVVNAGICSRFQQAQAIADGKAEVIAITTAKAGRPAPRPANSSLISVRWEAAGFTPLRPWHEALRDYLAALAPSPAD